MGFVMYEDQLRIPSSKKVLELSCCFYCCLYILVCCFKICQIGMKRTYLPAEEAAVDEKRRQFLQARCHQEQSSDSNGRSCDPGNEHWADKFTPRPSVEPVKNCTLVKKDIQEEIVQKLTSVLLQTQNFVESEKGAPWNAGGDYLLLYQMYLQ